jgi:hypothetical protein
LTGEFHQSTAINGVDGIDRRRRFVPPSAAALPPDDAFSPERLGAEIVREVRPSSREIFPQAP